MQVEGKLRGISRMPSARRRTILVMGGLDLPYKGVYYLERQRIALSLSLSPSFQRIVYDATTAATVAGT